MHPACPFSSLQIHSKTVWIDREIKLYVSATRFSSPNGISPLAPLGLFAMGNFWHTESQTLALVAAVVVKYPPENVNVRVWHS